MRTLAPILVLATACTGDLALDADHPLSAHVDADGGTVSGEGVQLDVPAGAVDQDVTLTAFPATLPVSGLTPLSPVWTFGPDGTQFKKPVTVRLALTADGTAPAIWWTKPGDLTSFELLRTTIEDGWAVATITHFSEGVAADGDCGCGDDDEAGDDDGAEAGDDDGAEAGDDPADPNEAAADTGEDAGDDDGDQVGEHEDGDEDATCVCDEEEEEDGEDAGDDDGSDEGDDTAGADDPADDTDGGDDPAEG